MANTKKRKRGLNRGDIITIGVIIAALLAFAIALIIYNSKSTSVKKLYGAWLYDTSEINLLQDDNSLGNVYSTRWEFTEDGKFNILPQGGLLVEGTYTADHGKLILTFTSGDSEEFAFYTKKGTLYLGDTEDKDDVIELTKTE